MYPSEDLDNFIQDEDHLKNATYNIYGTNSFKEITKSEEISTPKIITEENDNSINEEKDYKNNINNDIVASKYEIIKEISFIDSQKTNSNFINELTNGYIVISNYDKNLLIFDNNFKNILTIKFPFMINSINEIKNTEKNKIKIFACSISFIYKISLDIITKKSKIEKFNLSEEENQLALHDFNRNINSDIKNYNYHYIIQLNNNKQMLCTNYGIYECYNLDSLQEKMPQIVLLEQYIEGVLLKDNLICFKSNKQLTNGEDLLTIFNSYSKKIIKNINNYSFSISSYRLILFTQNENKKTLICACTKYSSEQKNGILLVNFEFNGDEFETNISFEEIESFSVNCICKLNNKNKDNEIFLLVGGVDEEYNRGIIKLYKLEFNENETNIEFLQNIELGDNIDGSISYICQLKNGKIIVSCGNGNILYTAPNLDGYNDDLDDDL